MLANPIATHSRGAKMPDSESPPESWVFNTVLSEGTQPLQLREGVNTKILGSDAVMLSFVELPAGTPPLVHSHPEEQWGILLAGECTRVQHGEEVLMAAGSVWRTPPNVPHAIFTTTTSAHVLDVFVPPRPSYRRSRVAEERSAE